MVHKLDQLDLKIICHLQKDGRISTAELARKVKSSRPTVTNRLRQLMDEELVIVEGGLNLRKIGFKIASLGLEVKNESTRKEVEAYLNNCPRVLYVFRTPEKANIHAIVWGENDETINSTIESFRDLQNVDIVHADYLGTPINGNIIINVESSEKDESPCGMKCADCYRYIKVWCLGCPNSKYYKDPLQ